MFVVCCLLVMRVVLCLVYVVCSSLSVVVFGYVLSVGVGERVLVECL